jgi:hypothetical protein
VGRKPITKPILFQGSLDLSGATSQNMKTTIILLLLPHYLFLDILHYSRAWIIRIYSMLLSLNAYFPCLGFKVIKYNYDAVLEIAFSARVNRNRYFSLAWLF